MRLKEGHRARFEAGFAGYPKPEVTWYFKGEVMKNSSKVQIKVRDDSSTLTIIDCTFDDAGIYECRASNNLGTDKTKGSLTVNSKLHSQCKNISCKFISNLEMTDSEKAEYEKMKANGLQAAVDDEEKKVIKKEQDKKAREEKKEEKKK